MAIAVTQAINARDRGAIEKLTTEDVELRMPPREVFYGWNGIRQFVDELERRLPELTVVVSHLYDGEDFAVVEWDASGLSPGQEPIEELGCVVLRLRDGKLAKANLYGDYSVWRELGEKANRKR
jgi:ketosteroid isomerase-like protein